VDSQARHLLDRESNAKDVLRSELPNASGRMVCELTLNVTNVRLNFEEGTATVDDELDPTVSIVVSLADLVRHVGELA